MNIDVIYVPDLKTTCDVVIRPERKPVEVKFFDHEDGSLLLIGNLPDLTGHALCAFINTYDYPWLYNFLIDNDLGHPTYRCFIRNSCLYEEFKFVK